MRTKILNRLIVALFMLLVGMVPGYALPAEVLERDSGEHCMITLDGIHQQVRCFDPVPPVPPVAITACGMAVMLSFEDQYFQLGCTVSGFEGYFALSRWAAHKIKGDYGVDVTGAPNSILVEGANTASVVVAPESVASLEIAIPANGFVSFDWRYIGGSNFPNQSFWIDVNGKRADEMHAGLESGSFFYGPLEVGDVLGLHAIAPAAGFEVQLANFEFMANAMGVIERRWKATGLAGQEAFFTQLVSLEKPNLSLVTFPGNFDGFEYPVLGWGGATAPSLTGYPVLDEDGLLSTTHDQYPLLGSKSPFALSWEDEMLYDESGNLCTIFREWTVADQCGGNIIVHTQFIKFQGACPEMPMPTPYGEQAAPSRLLEKTGEGLDITAASKADEW